MRCRFWPCLSDPRACLAAPRDTTGLLPFMAVSPYTWLKLGEVMYLTLLPSQNSFFVVGEGLCVTVWVHVHKNVVHVYVLHCFSYLSPKLLCMNHYVQAAAPNQVLRWFRHCCDVSNERAGVAQALWTTRADELICDGGRVPLSLK